MKGKCWVKTWTALQAEIFHSGSPQVFLGQQDSRESEGGRSGGGERPRETESEKETEREGEIMDKEILIQATVQGRISAPSRCQWFRCISDFREATALLSQNQ